MKKIVMTLLVCLCLLTVLGGCGRESGDPAAAVRVVCTNFPAYDFARQVVGDRGSVTMLLPVGGESHGYEPSARDIIRIGESDLFVYTGGVSDSWLDVLVMTLDHPIRTLKMMDCVTLFEEETTEGMEPEEEEEEGTEYDEHVWTAPLNAVKITEAIRDAMIQADPDGEAIYTQNAAAYCEEIRALDADFRSLLDGADTLPLIFGDRFPLRYFTEAYGLTYYAAFPGCAEETEPSAATLRFLIDKVNEWHIPTVLTIECSGGQVADAIAGQTGAKTACFHSCHNVTREEWEGGATYVSLMRRNLEMLKTSGLIAKR